MGVRSHAGKNKHGTLALAAALMFTVACGSPDMAFAETHEVLIVGLDFIPAELDVAVGDTVTWVNQDVVPHTATADDGSFDSEILSGGDEWSVQIDSAGTFDYLCVLHPNMRGVINAQ